MKWSGQLGRRKELPLVPVALKKGNRFLDESRRGGRDDQKR